MLRTPRADPDVVVEPSGSYLGCLTANRWSGVTVRRSRAIARKGVSVRSGRGMGPVKRISHVEARPHKVLSFCW